jgi:hypothetical protein
VAHRVELADAVEHVAPAVGIDAVGIGQVQDRSPLLRSFTPWCVVGRKAAAPERASRALRAGRALSLGHEHDERGQVAVLAAQP